MLQNHHADKVETCSAMRGIQTDCVTGKNNEI